MASLLLLVSVLLPSTMIGPEDPPRKYQVVSPRDEGVTVTGLNEVGDIVGLEWVEEAKSPGVLNEVPFFARGKEKTVLPLLKGYTTTLPAAVSDTGLVVGRVSMPMSPGRRVPLRNQAFLWDRQAGIRGLGALEGDWGSTACGITRDGDRISGYSLGDGRNRACVWERVGDTWKGIALPHADRLSSQVVAISSNGQYVSSLDGAIPCLWTRSKTGEWTREAIGDPSSLAPRAVNDSGMVVGLRSDGDASTHAIVWTREGGLKPLEEPTGYVRSEAHAVNNDGVVVGFVDGPRGSDVGPKAFVHNKGRLRLIDEGGPNFVDASAINNHGQVAGVMERAETEEGKPDPPGPPKP